MGQAAAHFLARQGLDVLLLDRADFPRDKTCGDALTPRAVAVLDAMGILNDLRRVGYCINQVEIFAPAGHSTVAAFPQRPGLPDYALTVQRLTLDNAIRERALASGAKFEGGTHVTGIEPNSNEVVVNGKQRGQPISVKARLAIIATGANLKLLLRLGLLHQRPRMMVAARTYFSEVEGLRDRIYFHFDGVPLPGYGWVFPLSDSSANVGAGFLPRGGAMHRSPATPQRAFDGFIAAPRLQAMLAQARQATVVQGYPLRVDFLTAPTFTERVLLVGEAAGLVNPLTGEGIDYALESGKLAAEYLASLFAAGDFSRDSLRTYDTLLRRRFQALFLFCNRVRDLFLRRPLLNRLVRAAARQPDLQTLLTNIVLGSEEVSTGVSLNTVLKASFALAAADYL